MTPQPTSTTAPSADGSTQIPIFCDCCPRAPKKMAVLHGTSIEIVGRHSGKKHRVRLQLPAQPNGH